MHFLTSTQGRWPRLSDMRIKLLYDLAYTASLERFDTFLRTELGIILKTPLVMLRMTQGR